MDKHTPTPWTQSEISFDFDEWKKLYNENQVCVGKGRDVIALIYGSDDSEKANAAFIVRSTNNFYRMKNALIVAQARLAKIEEPIAGSALLEVNKAIEEAEK